MHGTCVTRRNFSGDEFGRTAPSVWRVEIEDEQLSCTGSVFIPSEQGAGCWTLMVYGPRLSTTARRRLVGRFRVRLTVGQEEEEARLMEGWARVRSLSDEFPGYVLRLSLRLDSPVLL